MKEDTRRDNEIMKAGKPIRFKEKYKDVFEFLSLLLYNKCSKFPPKIK